MQLFTRAAAAAALAFTLSAPALAHDTKAHDTKAGTLEIVQPWARATPPGAAVGGGYLTIVNHGTEPDTLTGGTSPVSEKVEVHEMSMDNGIMRMQKLTDGLTIPPGETVTLAPGGYHLMLTKLKAPLKEGSEVPVTLTFAKAGEVPVTLTVESIGAKAPSGGMADMSGMSGMDSGTMEMGKESGGSMGSMGK